MPLRQFAALAGAARRRGNGILEVTARGNLQIRGLTAETVPLLAGDIADAGIALAEGVAIETPPLAGVDPAEIASPLPLACAVAKGDCGTIPARRILAAKLSIIIDGGGRLHLGGVTADIRLRAFRTGGRRVVALVRRRHDEDGPSVAVVSSEEALPAVLDVLSALAGMGRGARGRDLDAAALTSRIASAADQHALSLPEPAPHPVGRHRFGDGRVVLGLGLAFGQIVAEDLQSLLEALERLGATEIRLAPDHAVLVTGLSAESADDATIVARDLGLRVSPDDPGNHIAACAGRGACASALIDTKAAARMLIGEAPTLLDGSMTVHVSGCAKGCAKPSASALGFSGAPIGYGLVVNGPASAVPSAYIGENGLKSALRRLDRAGAGGETRWRIGTVLPNTAWNRAPDRCGQTGIAMPEYDYIRRRRRHLRAFVRHHPE